MPSHADAKAALPLRLRFCVLGLYMGEYEDKRCRRMTNPGIMLNFPQSFLMNLIR